MASSTHKHYHDEDFDAKGFVEAHFSHGNVLIIEENVGFPMKILHDLFSSGQVKGNILLDISIGSIVYQLFSACNVFKEIYVVKFTDANIKHLKKWLEKGDEATDWSFAAKRVSRLQGNREMNSLIGNLWISSYCGITNTSTIIAGDPQTGLLYWQIGNGGDGWKEQEEKVRRAMKSIVEWDIFENSCIDPLLVPQVDCVLSLWILNVISKTKEEFQRNLKNFTSRLKIGGYLVLFSPVNMTFYRVGQHKFFHLAVDENFIKESVIKAGFIIEKMDLKASMVKCDLLDYDHVCFILARKEREG